MSAEQKDPRTPLWVRRYRQLSRLDFAWDVAGTRAGRGCRCQSLANPYTVWKELTFTSVSTLHPHRLFNQQFFSFWTGARPLWAQKSQVDAAQQKDHRGPVYSCRQQQPSRCCVVRGRVKTLFFPITERPLLIFSYCLFAGMMFDFWLVVVWLVFFSLSFLLFF